MDEATIVRKMVATLNKIPEVYCLRTHGGTFQQKGTPDIIGCAKGMFFAIEAKKSHREKPSLAQIYNLRKFQEAGGMTFVSHDKDVKEVVQWIQSL